MFPPEPLAAALEGFEVLERLGAGAAGEVFLARSPGGRLVAIKTIAGAGLGTDDDRFRDTLAREASVCARLRHPCIVQVRALREHEGVAALVFEYVPGVALARVLRLCEARGVRLPDRPAWHIVERVLTALAYAHGFHDDRGDPTPIVHRDVSPANVLLDWVGGVKIADFGIAKVLGVSPATGFGLVKGTPGCMAPEQARGDAVDQRADVYAAALLAWRLATGRLPFGRHAEDEFELLRAMRNPRIKPLDVIRPDLPTELLEAVARALQVDPARRTIAAREFADIVRSEVDVVTGQAELTALLAAWKHDLELAVRRAAEADSDTGRHRVEHTLRYEEVALAFDEEPPADAPTYEGHALPSEPWPVAPAALEADEPRSIGVLSSPPLPPAIEPRGPIARSEASSERATGVPPRRLWGAVVAALAIAAAGVAAALLGMWTR